MINSKFPDTPGEIRLKKAREEALLNWQWWRKDFTHDGSFADLPVFQEYVRFLGFGFDYSVFRLYSRKTMFTFFERLTAPSILSDFVELDDFHNVFCRIATDTGLSEKQMNHISMCSKLLALWKPEKFPMWDSLARDGLRRLHGNTRGHNYAINSPAQYNIFRHDYATLERKWRNNIDDVIEKKDFNGNPDAGRYRIVDNYLMGLSRKPDDPTLENSNKG